MKLCFAKKLKVFLIAVLVVLLAGMTMLGVLGFNQTVDNKASYEMQVSLDQNIEEAKVAFKDATVSALESNGVSVANYSMQEMNDGFVLLYKLSANVDEATQANIESGITTALENYGLEAEVKVYENLGSFYSEAGMIALALGIAVVVICLYAMVMNKVSGGVAVLASSVLSALLFTALTALTRLPAEPYFSTLLALSTALSASLALVLVSRYKAVSKSSEKASALEIVESVNNSLFKIYLAIAVGVLLTAIVAGVIGWFGSVFLGLGILVAGVSGLASAIYMTPYIWSLIKGKNN